MDSKTPETTPVEGLEVTETELYHEEKPTVASLADIPTDKPELLYKAFQAVFAELKKEVDHVPRIEGDAKRKNAHDILLSKLSQLSDWVVDVGPHLQTRDQETYSTQVKSLQTLLRTAINTRRTRFKFKAKVTTPSPGSSEAPSPIMRPKQDNRRLHFSAPGTIDSDSDVLPTDRPPAPTSISAAAIAPLDHSMVADEVGGNIDLPAKPGRPVTLTNLHETVVRNMSNKTLPALYVKKILRSVIDGGYVEGAAHITAVRDSVVIVRAKQVRIHECKNCTVYLDVKSMPIVEDCEDMRVAPIGGDWLEEQYGPETGDNLWDQVQDFNWHKEGPSPHWRAVGDKETLLGDEFFTKYLRGPDIRESEVLKAARVNTPCPGVILPGELEGEGAKEAQDQKLESRGLGGRHR